MADENKTAGKTTEDAVKEAVEKARAKAAESEAQEIPIEDEDAPEQEAEQQEPAGDSVEEKPEDTAASGEDDKKSDQKHKNPFARKKDPRDDRIAELTDRVQRQMAEFDNFRKRTEKEKSASFDMGASSVIERILPIVDNFERGLAAAPKDEAAGFVDGMDKIYKQLVKTLDDMGVTPIEAVGQTFDPNLHNAVMHVDDEQYGESEVVEELQKGYKFHDRVIRHSMVKVAN